VTFLLLPLSITLSLIYYISKKSCLFIGLNGLLLAQFNACDGVVKVTLVTTSHTTTAIHVTRNGEVRDTSISSSVNSRDPISDPLSLCDWSLCVSPYLPAICSLGLSLANGCSLFAFVLTQQLSTL
jgi:hypothetical protein